jgi:hypothetical protein
MRAYSASSEETLRARDLLNDWAGEGFLTAEQRQHMEQDTAGDLRRTNIFLRIVLFLFTLVVVGAAVGLFFTIFLPRSASETTIGSFLVAFAVVSYAAAEIAVSQFRFYRHGIEEALAACSVGFLCAGIFFAFVNSAMLSSHQRGTEFLVPAVGAIASLWIWHRFGFAYASLAAMIFGCWLPVYWTPSHAAQHVLVAVLYSLGLIAVVAFRPRYRLTYLNTTYAIAEGLLWFGIYLAINLQLSSVSVARGWLGDLWPGSSGLGGVGAGASTSTEFSKPFYWATWVLIWCLPPIVMARGLRLKDRFVIAAGAVAACLTLVTNKPYLGWERHTWDAMLFGAVLIAVALLLRRWLARGPTSLRKRQTLDERRSRGLRTRRAEHDHSEPAPR